MSSALVLVTDRIERSIKSILIRDDVPEVTKREFKHVIETEGTEKNGEPRSISFSCVQQLHQLLSKGVNSKTLYLHELLEGADVYHPPLKQPERNPELVARLERLKAEQEDREYRRMTKNVKIRTYGESPLAQVGQEVRTFQVQMMGVLNVVLTIGGGFVFGYMAAAYQSQPVIWRVTAGLIVAFIVAVADLYFFIKHEV
ncbi:transmembrane protein 199-like [Lytechinus variegatus]|uniref:transmembrane protein 199-like n=1 Tax=Lytechinus variegatus TaxID=7654 RepID=UPI001BB25800|nr:transmembrane protein 199-like [Lytechinus variegatus]